MKRFAMAVFLAGVLSGSVLAGDSHTGGAPAPGDVPSTGSTAPGEIQGVGLSTLLTILDLAF
jgi:hypothetical protein